MRVLSFNVIVADPPWQYGDRGAGKRAGTDSEYPTQHLVDIMNLWQTLEYRPASNALLFLWITNGFLANGVGNAVCRAWGFEPRTVHTWNKVTKAGAPRIGVGRYGRNSTEHFIVATRGTPGLAPFKTMPTSHSWQRPRQHSRKPEEFYRLLDAFPCRKLELYARRPRDGWVVWGNEV